MNRASKLSSLLVLALAAVGCGSGQKSDPVAQTEAGLVAFQSCDELETYIEDTAVAQMRENLEGYGWGWYGGGPARAEDGAATPTAGTQSNAAPDHSETNAQVAGVDEADFVKTDGNRVFYIVGRRLMVLRSWPAEQTAIDSTTVIEGYPTEMFLDGSRLVVFAQVPRAYDPGTETPAAIDYYGAYWYWGATATKIMVFDVTTNTPVLQRAFYLHGSYASSRRIDSSVRVVLSASLVWPDMVWPQWSQDEATYQAARDAAIAQNEQLIRARALDQWLPRSYSVESGNSVQVPRDCTRYHRPTTSSRLGLTIVASFDLSSPGTPMDMTAVVAEAGQVYASREALYVATPEWVRSAAVAGLWTSYEPRTDIHKLALVGSDRVAYAGSGTVPGYILDQFSMDESQGFMRVATTTWGSTNVVSGQTTTENRVYVLGPVNGRLSVVGKTDPIAPGEQIYSSRFSGNRGFVVTYRQVDPLFTLDLTDPLNPHVVGELSIPGFSTYIHLLDETHLLTIGNDTTANGNGGEIRNGLALQIFDVSDMANPRLTAKQVVGTHSSYSEALWDHKAFNYFPKTGMLAIPFTDWNWDGSATSDYWSSFVSALKVYHIDAAGQITPVGQVDHSSFYQEQGTHNWYWWYGPDIRRSVQIEGYVYSFSYAGVKVNPVADMTQTTAAIALPPENVQQQ
jgi:uncharacterized secreted protein with C-terminal beta-propeller domain